MEDWQLDFEWLHVQNLVQKAMKQQSLPDLNTILFLIGIQELGRWKREFSKEEKQDLMHIAVCRLLAYDGYFEFAGRDEDGWPHYRQVLEMPAQNIISQEKMLKTYAVKYFKEWESE